MRRRGVLAGLGLVAVLASACSHGQTVRTVEAPPTSAAPPVPPPPSQITDAFHGVLGPTAGAPALADSLQFQDRFGDLFQQAAAAHPAETGHTAARIDAVEVHGDWASVTYSVLIDGTESLVRHPGWAVIDGGRWKVAAATECDVLRLGGSPTTGPCAPPAPGDPADSVVRTVFLPGTSLEERVAAVEDGGSIRDAIAAAVADPRAPKLDLRVSGEWPLGADAMVVDVDFLLDGQVAATQMPVELALADGAWKVRHASYCAVIQTGGRSC